MRKTLLACVVLAACGGGGISSKDLPDEIEGAQCDRLVRCEGVEDRATCDAALILDAAQFAELQAAIDDGSIKYDSGAAGDCADAISGQKCTFEGFHQKNPCDDVFVGTVPAGGACVIDLQCANGGDCNQTDPNCDNEVMCCLGTCAGSLTESAVGGPCGDDLHFCALDSFCKTSGTGPGVCTAVATTEGAACDELDGCANPMYCNLSFTTNMGTCKTPAASGAACVRTDLLPCSDSRDYCDMTMLKCVRSAAVGAACGANGVSCVDYASCIASVCVADLKLGAACQVDTGADCAGTLDCIGGTCQVPPTGMTCKLP